MKYCRFYLLSLLFIAVILLSSTSCGFMRGVKGSISGTVYVDGRPQAFGTVQVYNELGTLVSSDRCTETGHYIIRGLDAGRYEVTYLNARGSPIGQPTIVEVRLGRFEQVDLNITVQGVGQQQ
jgi:hypothetical protein